ncbi:MAG: permease [Propionibacteriaceae bacterium]
MLRGLSRDKKLGISAGILLALIVIITSQLRSVFPISVSPESLNAWLAVFIGLVVQAIPFLVLGVGVSAAITAWLPEGIVARMLPRNQLLAVPVAGVAGMALPGCECASVPVSDSLLRRGMSPAAAFTFLLAAPAVNPVVLVATAIAFPTIPAMPWARLAASLLAAVIMGWLWIAVGKEEWIQADRHDHDRSNNRLEAFRAAFIHDFVHAGGYLVLGAMIAAGLNIFAPANLVAQIGSQRVFAVIAMGLIAVVIAVCSEADAFVAAAMTQFSPTAQLAFMVVSPMVDVKLMVMQRGTFGRGFMWRFAPTTFIVAIVCAATVGAFLW